MRRPSKENTGNENICVKYNLHLRPRIFVTTASTSDFLNPALRACCRARPIKSLNSLTEGAEIALRITTSRLPTTTNCVPTFNPNRSRISSGMTTCPLDDMRVVAKLSIDTPFLTGKIIGHSGRSVNRSVLGARPWQGCRWCQLRRLMLSIDIEGFNVPILYRGAGLSL
jgi:hypothetical protein